MATITRSASAIAATATRIAGESARASSDHLVGPAGPDRSEEEQLHRSQGVRRRGIATGLPRYRRVARQEGQLFVEPVNLVLSKPVPFVSHLVGGHTGVFQQIRNPDLRVLPLDQSYVVVDNATVIQAAIVACH